MPTPTRPGSTAPYRGVDDTEIVRWYASQRDRALAETRVHFGPLPVDLPDSPTSRPDRFDAVVACAWALQFACVGVYVAMLVWLRVAA